jgi:hypothetical protein
MSNDERPQNVSAGDPYEEPHPELPADMYQDPYGEADTTRTRVQSNELTPLPEPPSAAEVPAAAPAGRWAKVSEPAKRHPIGLAVGTALAGLVIGLLGGVALDSHPTMPGHGPGLAAVDRQHSDAPYGPDGDRHGPAGEGRHGGGGPGEERGPGGRGGPRGPAGEGQGPGGAQRPDAPPPPPADGGAAPGAPTGPGASAPARPANPGGEAPQQPPLPAERGAAPSSGA